MRIRTCRGVVWGVLAAATAATVSADAASMTSLRDYRGKGEVRVSLEETQDASPVQLTIAMEQIFRKPGTILLSLSLFGDGLRHSFLTDASVEQSYNPVQGIVVEKRYQNLEKSSKNPLYALQFSMYEIGCTVERSTTRKTVGSETLLGYPCDVVELASREILTEVHKGGLLGGDRAEQLLKGRTKVWLSRDFGLPIRVEIYGAAPEPAMTVSFAELKVNGGVGGKDLRLDVPEGTRKISVTADLADPDWEKKMDAELRRQLELPGPAGAAGP